MSVSNSKPKILMLMSGSIACYKACGLVSLLVKNNFDVEVAASSSALKFIGEATVEGLTGKPVHKDLWQTGSAMEHIHLERWADLIIAAPASAHFINRCANGVGDDLLTTLFLAHEFKKPFLMAPAMNTAMYLNPATQKSITQLKQWGVQILESASGVLACGETGYGKLLEPELLFQEIKKSLNLAKTETAVEKTITKPLRVLVTAGGTREPLDDVRFITNTSTGTTGEQIAREMAEMGFEVTLDLAQSASAKPRSEFYKVARFDSYKELADLLKSQLSEQDFDFVVHAAAVSDFSVEKAEGKISSNDDLKISLKRNPKILDQLKIWSRNKKMKLVGFKLTSKVDATEIAKKVRKLFEGSNADLVVQNDLSTLENRTEHQFNIYKKDTLVSAKGVTQLTQVFYKELL